MASNFVPQPQQPQEMETNNNPRAFQAITLSVNLLSEQDLCSVSLLNSDFLTAARENHLWQPILSKLEQMPLHDFVDVSSADFPTEIDVSNMLIPPRIHGERRDRWTFLPHSRDRAARRHPKGPLVLGGSTSWWHGNSITALKMENGKLYDGFYRTQDDDEEFIWGRETVWLERTFPIQCNACHGVTLNDEDEMLQHCAQYKHITNAETKHPIPPQFVDPRHDPEYETLDAFHKAQVLSEYRSMVISYLRAPMNDAALANMEVLVEGVKNTVTWLYDLSRDDFAMDEQAFDEFEQDYDTALFYCTLERTMNVCVEEFGIKEFLARGLKGSLVANIILPGWESFQPSEYEDQVHLASLVSGSYLVASSDYLSEYYVSGTP